METKKLKKKVREKVFELAFEGSKFHICNPVSLKEEIIEKFFYSLIDNAYEQGKNEAINDTIDIIAKEEGWEDSANYYKKLVKEKLSHF